jgi:MFS family permease
MKAAERRAWLVVAALFVTLAVVFGAGIQTAGVVFTPMLLEFGWSRARVSAIFTSLLAARGLSAPLLGWLIDRIDARNVMVAGTALAGLAFVLASRAQSFAPICAAHMLIGIGVTAATLLPVSLVIVNWFDSQRGLAMAVTMAGISVGGMVMTLVADWATRAWSWRAGYVVLALPMFVIVIPMLLALVRSRPGSAKTVARKSGGSEIEGLELAAAVKTRSFWMIALAQACASFGNSIISVHLIPYLILIGYKPASAALVMSLALGISALIVPIAGWFADRVGSRPALALNFIVEAAGVALLLGATDIVVLAPLVLCLGITVQVGGVLLPLVTVNSLGLRRYGSLSGWTNLSAGLGAVAGPMVAGWLYDLVGSYVPALCLLIIVLGLGIIAALGCLPLEAEKARLTVAQLPA